MRPASPARRRARRWRRALAGVRRDQGGLGRETLRQVDQRFPGDARGLVLPDGLGRVVVAGPGLQLGVLLAQRQREHGVDLERAVGHRRRRERDHAIGLALAQPPELDLRLRAAPDRDAETLATIPFNTNVELYGQGEISAGDSRWWYTVYEGREGWLDGQYLLVGSACESLPERNAR